ncbi:haloacid dehalogenase type II [Granulosicoccaceae sp. 1_MG-2023]|nr:haloacid dehalogenase type II [Granulosicoccaceae sp. 1_MG-2023]
MTYTLAFDVYGTLIDTHGVVEALQAHVGPDAVRFSQCWRDKQLEYSFRRGLMGCYADFSICTRQALDYTCDALDKPLPEPVRESLMAVYRVLPAFDDVAAGLQQVRAAGHRVYAFSNGSAAAVNGLLRHAGLDDLVDGAVSVEAVASFKPDPAVYAHFLAATGSDADSVWLISSNPFDVLGAQAVGWKTAWVQRNPATVFDPWGVTPSCTVTGLDKLASCLEQV